MSNDMQTSVGEAPSINARDIIALTARLAQILAEEADYLSEMKVPKIEELQREKLFITGALDAQRKKLAKYPFLSETIPSQDKSDLQEVVNVFETILEENHRKLLMAREVNNRIVGAITAVVSDYTRSASYDGKGVNGNAPFETLSVTLNQTI